MFGRSIRISNFKRFPPSGRVIPPDGDLAPINLFVGPNGSGKTTLLAALELAFGYDPQTSHGHFSHNGRLSSPESSLPAPQSPLEVSVSYRWPDNGRHDVFSHRYDPASPDAAPRDTRVNDSLLPSHEEHPRNRLFALGWRRFRPSYDSERAFSGPAICNRDAIKDSNWARIRRSALDFFDLDLGGTWSGISDAVDARGGRVLENSDGYAAALYFLLEVEKFGWSATFTVEEPENHLHQGLQRPLIEYLHHVACRGELAHQFLITSHSPAVVAAVLALPDHPSGARRKMRRDWAGVAISEVYAPSHAWDVADALGHRPSDVFQPNGIIWVEGPSDVIYVKTWLDAFSRRAGKSAIRWGLDAEVVWYGGSVLADCGVSTAVWDHDGSHGAVLELLALNPNAVVVMDRDDYDGHDSKRPRKEAIIRAIEQHVKGGRKQLAWLTGPGTREIESYIPATVWGALRTTPERGKVKAARAYASWVRQQGEPLSAMVRADDTDILQMLAQCYHQVQSWKTG